MEACQYGGMSVWRHVSMEVCQYVVHEECCLPECARGVWVSGFILDLSDV